MHRRAQGGKEGDVPAVGHRAFALLSRPADYQIGHQPLRQSRRVR